MTIPRVAVATMTLARSTSEAALLRDSVSALARHRWPMWITDGGSSHAFISHLATIPQAHVGHATGLVSQIGNSLQHAGSSGAPDILYTEPDKFQFFADHLAPFLTRALAAPGVVSVAARSPAAFETYPPHQRHAESVVNERCTAAFGIAGDFSYGPFLMPREIVPYLTSIPPHLGWGWRHAAFALAHRLGYRLALIEGHYDCPESQRDETADERAHRERQRRENLAGLSFGLTVPIEPTAG